MTPIDAGGVRWDDLVGMPRDHGRPAHWAAVCILAIGGLAFILCIMPRMLGYEWMYVDMWTRPYLPFLEFGGAALLILCVLWLAVERLWRR